MHVHVHAWHDKTFVIVLFGWLWLVAGADLL
jgi:hypothetical protein